MSGAVPGTRSGESRDTVGWLDRLIRGDLRVSGIFFILLAGFYLATAAGNLSETDDVYAFAYRAENFPLDYLTDPRLLLYHAGMRLLFLCASSLGLESSALTLMRLVSALSAAAALIVFLRVAVSDLKLRPSAAIAATCVLAVSYGFWRYAAEAEVYIPAILLILLVFHGICRVCGDGEETDRFAKLLGLAGCSILSGLTVLFYQPSVIPLFFAFPLLMLSRRHIANLVLYLTIGGFVVLAGYLAGFLVFWPEPPGLSAFSAFLSQRAEEFSVPPMSLRTIVVSVIRSAFALGHDFVSMNWIFALNPVAEVIQNAYSSNVITEEIFLARRAGAIAYLAIGSLTLLVVAFFRVLLIVRIPALRVLRDRRYLVILVWTALNGAIVGRLNPAGLEAWIMLLPPLIILFAACVIDPCLDKGGRRSLGGFVAALILHNAVGGMVLVSDPANEYDRVKGAWAIDQAGANDLVLIAGNAGFAESMRYLSPANVALIGVFQVPGVAASLLDGDLDNLLTRTRGRDFSGYPLRDLIATTWHAGGRVIFFEEFFTLPKGITIDSWPEFGAVKVLQSKLERVYEAPQAGATYLLFGPDR